MSQASDPNDTVPAAELSYGDAAAELDAIIGELDQGLIDVDLLEERFRRATASTN